MIYFDYGATSFPKPRGMLEQMEECMLYYCGNPGRSGHRMSMKMGEKIYEARKEIGTLLGIEDPSRLIFTKNTTEGLNLAMSGILKEGDHVVTTAMEHNSVLRPLKELEERGVTHTIVPADKQGNIASQLIKSAIQENTKMIVMTGASNVTGTIMPMEAIAEYGLSKGILTLLDGAQCIGNFPIHIGKLPFSMIAFPGHKGLLGPQGTGCLYVNPELQERMYPLIFGGTGTSSKSTRQPLDFPDGYEAGTLNGPGIIGLGYSVKYVSKIGVDVIHNFEKDLITHLDCALRNMDFVTVYGPKSDKKVGITLFNIKGLSSEEVTERLNREYGIAVRGGYHCAGLAHKSIGTWDQGAVRLSVGPFNTLKEIQFAIKAIYRIGSRR
ncbi:MAG: aminotransferase class V-fold PLP-dependent enzyme [Firmicutes bacterium]|nr:aminotransferase class V-fold PLP-dependent enzyme [Bacillota bacterium]